MAIPLQWVLANTCCVLAEDSYHWMDFPTTICDIGKKLATHNVLWFLRLLGAFHILISLISLVSAVP